MIRYALQCEAGHGFESWFADGPAFDSLSRAGHLACPVCGDAKISKALMTPSLRPKRVETSATGTSEARTSEARAPEPPAPSTPPQAPAANGPAPTPHPLSREALETALTAMRREVEANSEYVGMNFAAEARRIHDGNAVERPIYGEAKPEEARRLIEDGVRVTPLPFLPRRKTN